MPSRFRVIALALILFSLFSLLIIQYYKIQIIEQDKWTKLAEKQHFFVVKEPYKRGRFFSNTSFLQGQAEVEIPFVYDTQKFHLFIDPLSIPLAHHESIAEKISELLKLNKKEQKKLFCHFGKKSRCRRVALWVSQDNQQDLQEWWLSFIKGKRIPRNALYFEADYKRCYPFGALLGQVLHTVQDVREEKTDRMIPTGGLELYFDEYLRGFPGKRKMMRSPRNSFEIGELLQSPEDGADIYLTINHVIQSIAEDELEKGVKKSEAVSGWAIVIDPWNGEILALAQYPYFYPEDYRSYFNDPLKIEHTRVKAITDSIEPGSVMKPLSMAIGLIANKVSERPLFDPDEKIPTMNGSFPGRSKPLFDGVVHNFLNMDMAIRRSSNIYIARVIEKVVNTFGAQWYRHSLTQFGFTQPTGIELFSETRGYLPMPGKKYKNGVHEWLLGTPPALAMGYNLQVSYLQLVRAYSVLANGGRLVNPTLVRKIVRGKDVLLDNTTADRIEDFPRVMSPEICRRVIKGMKYVTKWGGSGSRGDVIGYTEAGKSSTSKKNFQGKYSESRYRASFIGITPTSKPRFVILVGMDEPKYAYIPGLGKNHNGGVCCAPVFARIAQRSLEYAQVTPDDPGAFPKGDHRSLPLKKDWFDETRLLQEMYEKWNNKR